RVGDRLLGGVSAPTLVRENLQRLQLTAAVADDEKAAVGTPRLAPVASESFNLMLSNGGINVLSMGLGAPESAPSALCPVIRDRPENFFVAKMLDLRCCTGCSDSIGEGGPMPAPVWVRVLAGVVVAALGGLVVWLQSLDPLFGVPFSHSSSLTFLGLF